MYVIMYIIGGVSMVVPFYMHLEYPLLAKLELALEGQQLAPTCPPLTLIYFLQADVETLRSC